MGGGDELGSIIGLVAKNLVVGEDPPQLPIVALTLVDQDADELCLHKLMTPLPSRADALTKKSGNSRLETSVVTAVSTTVVAAISEFAFSGL